MSNTFLIWNVLPLLIYCNDQHDAATTLVCSQCTYAIFSQDQLLVTMYDIIVMLSVVTPLVEISHPSIRCLYE